VSPVQPVELSDELRQELEQLGRQLGRCARLARSVGAVDVADALEGVTAAITLVLGSSRGT